MDKTTRVVIIPTKDLKNLQIKPEGHITFQDLLAMGLALILQGRDSFMMQVKDASEKSENPVEYNKAMLENLYDDLNVRFTNVLEGVLPFDESSFLDDAMAEMRDQDKAIELKFKEMQYNRMVALIGNGNEGSITLDEKGEVVLFNE